MEEQILVEYIKGKLSKDESSEVLKWIMASEENTLEFSRLKNIFALSHLASQGNTRREILLQQSHKITGYGLRRFLMAAVRYAAVILITAGLISLYNLTQNRLYQDHLSSLRQTITSPPGQTTEMVLADGSKVSLNSGTTISYSSGYGTDERQIWLEGEAYFDVVTNPEKPFIVRSKEIDVIATGTSFNVNAYPDDKEINVTLVDGSLQLKSVSGKLITTLASGENVSIDRANNWFVKTEVDTYFYTSWQQGIITFSNKRLGDIAKDLERWYNVEIRFEKESSKDIRYSGAILKNKPIDQVLEILKLTSKFNYDIQIDNERRNIITIEE